MTKHHSNNSTSTTAAVTTTFIWDYLYFWITVIICPVLIVIGVFGNLYASIVLIALRRITKNPAILTIVIIGKPINVTIVYSNHTVE